MLMAVLITVEDTEPDQLLREVSGNLVQISWGPLPVGHLEWV